jgi:hypothetical protein
MFRLIKQCTVAKDAWEILKTTHEGTSKVKMSRLQLLTTKFENLQMREDDSVHVHDFHMNIIDYANQFDFLGEKIPEEKLVRKILRSLPKKFDMKVTAIEEAQDISSLKIEELVGSLQTFELSMNERYEKKNKSIDSISNTDDDGVLSELDTKGSISETLVLIEKLFKKVLRRMDVQPRTNVGNICLDISKNGSTQRKPRADERPNKDKGSQFQEYDDEIAKHVMAFTGKWNCDEEVSYKELCINNESQKNLILELQAERNDHLTQILSLKNEVTLLNSKLENMGKQVRMLNSGTDLLEEILGLCLF